MKAIIASVSSNSRRLKAIARRNGFDPVFVPTLKIVKIDISPQLSECPDNVTYSWAVFASITSASIFFNSKWPAELLLGTRIAAVGSSTAGFLRRKGIKVDFTPSEYTTEKLAEELPALPGSSVLILRSREGNHMAEEMLEKRGIKPCRLDLYETSFVNRPIKLDKIQGAKIVVFGSSREVIGFENRLNASNIKEFKETVVAACIGPPTRDAAIKMGYRTLDVPKVYTYKSLFELLSELKNEGGI